jgi:hypothetical protein
MSNNIMKHVDILELMRIHVYRPNPFLPGAFQVDLESLDKTKQVVLDERASKKLNEIIVEKCKQFNDARDPRVTSYIEEFVAKMCSEWHRAGLLVLDDIPEASSDPYAEVKKAFRN